MTERILTFFLVLSCLNFLSGQNNILRGIVKLQSSGSQPLVDVEISAFGSNTVYSNSNGMFQMEFRGKSPGSSISLLVHKEGYEVINEKEIERCIIRENPDEVIFIIMARQGDRNRQALSYYNIIINNSQSSFQKELNDLKSQLSELNENNEERNVLLKQISDLQEENYMEMKDIIDADEPFKATFLNDLESLEAEGISHPDIAEIRNLLNQ